MSPIGRFFVFLVSLPGGNMAAACRAAGISRATGYRYLRTARAAGVKVEARPGLSGRWEYAVWREGPFSFERLRAVRWF